MDGHQKEMTAMATKGPWTRDMMLLLLNESDKAVERALFLLFEKQTADEQRSKDTKHTNDRGFTQADARFFSQLVEEIKAGRSLAQHRLNWLRIKRPGSRFPSRIGKYAAQIATITNERIAEARAHEATWAAREKALRERKEYSDSFATDTRLNSEIHNALGQRLLWTARAKKMQPGEKLLQKLEERAKQAA
jgi:hypothetical protein